MEYGVRTLIPELGCAGTLRVVADTSGLHMGACLRSRHVFQRLGHCIDRMYPCRLHVSSLLLRVPWAGCCTFPAVPMVCSWTLRASARGLVSCRVIYAVLRSPLPCSACNM
jgi:hypothetical protein